MTNRGVGDHYRDDFAAAMNAFREQDSRSQEALEGLAAADPAKFFAAGIDFVAGGESSPGVRFLVQLLAKEKQASKWLLDPKLCTLTAATVVARAAAEGGVQVQASFEKALNKALQQQASAAITGRILRILSLLEATGSETGWHSFQVELMAYPDKVVRSKAALLIGRGQKNVEWIVRLLLNRDPRVQANSVETLWGFSEAEARPHLQEALKSKHNRVFANAALGLYRLGDPAMIHVLLEAIQHEDPAFRISALWAIGQTRDARFLPALSGAFKSAQGKERLAIAGALSRIRSHGKSMSAAGHLEIAIGRAALEPDGKRTLNVTLGCRPAKNLSGLKPTEFLIWENGAPVKDYQVHASAPAGPIVVGLVAPWFEAAGDPSGQAIEEGLLACLSLKRKDDLWRVDRYGAASASNEPAAEVKPAEGAALPYDDAAMTAEIRSAHGWIRDAGPLKKVLALPVPSARAAAGAMAAIERQCKSMGQERVRRHVFVLLNQAAAPLNEQTAVENLERLAQQRELAFHGIRVGTDGEWPRFRELCLSNPDGGFIETGEETGETGIAEAIEREYANVYNRFRIVYSRREAEPSGDAPQVLLRVASELGGGQVETELERPAPPAETPPATVPAPAPAPAPEAA